MVKFVFLKSKYVLFGLKEYANKENVTYRSEKQQLIHSFWYGFVV